MQNQDQISQSSSKKIWDLVVVGGGISGLGVLYAAKKAGLSVLLLEKNKLSDSTSNNSLRIMHGGFRYLQKMDLFRVTDSIKAYQELLQLFPSRVQPFPCLLPLNKFGLKSILPLFFAAMLYRFLAFCFDQRLRDRPKFIRFNKLQKLLPTYAKICTNGVFCWYDGLLDDPKLIAQDLLNLVSAQEKLDFLEDAEVKNFEIIKDKFIVNVLLSNTEEEILTKALVNATGRHLPNNEMPISEDLNYALALNVILNCKIEETYGLSLNALDRSLFFLVPRDRVSVLGTWYFSRDAKNIEPKLTVNEELKVKDQALQVLRNFGIANDQIAGFDLGIIPVKGFKSEIPDFYSKEIIFQAGNYIDLRAVKYTSFLNVGRRVLNKLKL